MSRTHAATLPLLILALLGGPRPAVASPPPAPPASDAFAFRSAFWLNLHHYLHALAGRDMGRRGPVLSAGDLERADALAGSDADDWSAAVAHYRAALADRDLLFDAGMRGLGLAMAETPDDAAPHAGAVGAELAAVLVRAAPVYRSTWWPRHAEANRRWIDALVPMIDEHGPGIVPRLETAYRITWPSDPIRVDVCAYAGWAGAYTSNGPSHITAASMDRRQRGLVALETVYHEAAHTLDHVIQDAIADAAHAQDRPPPERLWHSVIFYTSGDAIRRVADPEYQPYADRYGLWQRGSMGEDQAVLQAHWQRFLDGEIAFEDAIAAMVRDLGQKGEASNHAPPAAPGRDPAAAPPP